MNPSPDTFPDKHPETTRPYGLNWAEDLAEGDIIATSEWDIEGDDDVLTTANPTKTDTTTTVWLSGGTPGKQYRVVNKITAVGNPTKTLVTTMRINIRNK
jgi:hypothetical protein